jgi:hypothetical protein
VIAAEAMGAVPAGTFPSRPRALASVPAPRKAAEICCLKTVPALECTARAKAEIALVGQWPFASLLLMNESIWNE